MIALLFLIGCFVWGWAIIRLAGGLSLAGPERIVVGSMVGIATGGWLLYLIASQVGSLDVSVVVITLAVFAAAALGARLRPKLAPEPIPPWFLTLAGVVLVVLITFNLFAVFAPSGDGFVAAEHVWADTPFHTSIVSAFAYRDAYPPDYPLALGQPLNYPFLVDFLSGALLRHGFGLRASLIVVNVIVQAGFLLGLSAIVHRLTSSVRASIVAVILFFFLGNLGWLAVPRDVSEAGGFWSWLRDVPWSYTGETAGVSGRERLGTGLFLGNPIFLHLLPRRSAAFGMGVGASLLIVLEDLVRRRRVSTAIVVGLLAGVLPRVHAHTAIAVALIGATWVLLEAIGKRRVTLKPLITSLAVAGVVAAVIGLPEILAMREQTGSFFAFWPGWTGEPRAAFTGAAGLSDVANGLGTTVVFWVLNGGLLFLLLPLAWLRADDRLRRWYLPFVLVWLVGFLLRTQPWEWDNNNHFVWWQAGSVVLVAPLIASWLQTPSLVRRSAAAAAVAAMTIGGVLSFLYAGEHRLGLWSKGDIRFAQQVRRATPPDSVILTANGHTQPVIGLSGRQTVMGYWGWFTAHGLDGARYERDVNAMLAGDTERMHSLGVDYVVLGPWEEAQAAEKQYELGSVFDDSDRFEVVLDKTIDGRRWRLLKLLDLSS